MKSFRKSWLFTAIVLCFTGSSLSEAKYGKKLPSAVVVGTVYCDTCFQEDFSKTSHFISGALVAVECRGRGGTSSRKPTFSEEVKTDNHGEFKVHLPFSVSKHVKRIEACSVKLISSSEPYCAVASTATSSSLHLKSRKQGTHIFSAGFFTFKPLKQPTLCNQKPSIHNSKQFNSKKLLNPSPENPTMPILPPLPGLPALPSLPVLPQLPPMSLLPQLPPMPPLPGLPNFPPGANLSNELVSQPQLPQIPLLPSPPAFGFPFPPNPFQPPSILPPNPFQPPPASILPPNPLQPPPASIFPPNPFQPTPPPASIFPPNPFQPSPPPTSIFPPNPFQPSASPPPPLFNLPPIPGLTPPSPPPPTPTSPISFPPFPFQPSPGLPGFPGIPPASSSPQKTSTP